MAARWDEGFFSTMRCFPRATTSTLSPALKPSASRASRGITIRFFEETVAIAMLYILIPYFSTVTPFQNATYPLICLAAGFGSG